MPPAPPDRKLRRLVADLAVMAPEDLDAILAELAADQRKRVEALLAEFLGAGARPAARETDRRVEGLSPFLAARLVEARVASDFAMTPAARAALEDCAATLPARESAPTPVQRSWLSRLVQPAMRTSAS